MLYRLAINRNNTKFTTSYPIDELNKTKREKMLNEIKPNWNGSFLMSFHKVVLFWHSIENPSNAQVFSQFVCVCTVYVRKILIHGAWCMHMVE